MSTSGSDRQRIKAAQDEAAELAAWEKNQTEPDVGAAEVRALLDSIPGYEIVREVHRGGQGVVFQAIQRATQRKVAIKVMREGPLADARERTRFQREVQMLAQLDHPRILKIYDSATVAGFSYYVMDYISGQPLDRYAASGTRSGKDKLRLFLKICQAVNAAHLRGVIHRDLKPSNIRVDQAGEPHILDFGLAKVAGVGEIGPQAMTLTGQFVGSLPWASPEQAEGQPSKIDLRTDVYSLGVILYQMLTGCFPYEVIGNLRDVLDQIMRAEPVKPRTLRRDIDDELETILLKCLAKDRDRRYQTAGELARDLERYLAGEPIEAKRDSGWYVLRKTMLRYKIPTAAAVAFIVTGVGFGAAMTALYESAVAAQESAEAQAVAAQRQALEAQQAATFLQTLMGQGRSDSSVDWRTAYAVGQHLTSMPADQGFDLLHRHWQSVRDVSSRQQLLKAFWFARHPRSLQVLHMGVTDASPLVQAWAFEYLEPVALRSLAEDFADYLGWYARNGSRPLLEVMTESHLVVLGQMIRCEAQDRRGFRHTLEELAVNARFDAALRDRLDDQGCTQLMAQWLCAVEDQDLLDAVSDVLVAMRPSETLQREILLPLLASSNRAPATRMAAVQVLGRVHATWAAATLLNLLENAVETPHQQALADAVITALATIRAPGAVPPLMARLAEAVLRPGTDRRAIHSLAAAIAELGDASVIPELIALLDAVPVPGTVKILDQTLSKLSGVRADDAHDGSWWREWWDKNHVRFLEPARRLQVPPPPTAANSPRTATGTERQAVALEDLLAELERQVAADSTSGVFDAASRVAARDDVRAIPTLIGLIAADNSYNTVYGIGYFALSRLTGVPYDERYESGWWHAWWAKNRDRYPTACALRIPEFPRTKNHRPDRFEHGPWLGIVHEESVAELLARLEDAVRASDLGRIFTIATKLGARNDQHAIPTLIGMIGDRYDTVYGIGYFALGKLTDVDYDETHDGAWWHAWWNEARQHYPADVQNLPVGK